MSPLLVTVKIGVVALLCLVFVLSVRVPMNAFVAALGVAIMVAWTLRDLVAPVRLAADTDGVTLISGYAGRRRLSWAQVERVRVDERERAGLRSRMLEIDAGESLHLFSTYDLNAQVADVADELLRLRGTGGR